MFARRNERGFTLIELVIIIVILGILAAVAIPKYQDMSSEAKKAACKGALGGLRSGITIFYANKAVQTGTATWPGLSELRSPSTQVMAQGIPRNPYATTYPDSVVNAVGVAKGTVVGATHGWAYDSTTGEVWPNTNTAGENAF